MAATAPFGMTGMPGSNTGGIQQNTPAPTGTPSTTLGSNPSPFAPTPPAGQSVPALTSSIGTAGSDPGGLLAGLNPSTMFGLGQGDPNAAHNFVKAMRKAGFSSGVAGQLWNFINSGAGFNPQVAQALIAAMQPGVQRKEADITEQFSAKGLREGSPAAVGLGDFLAQEQLNEGQIWAQLYEQSVSNYMNVLLAGKGPAPASTMQNLLTGSEFIKNLATASASAATIGGGAPAPPGGQV